MHMVFSGHRGGFVADRPTYLEVLKQRVLIYDGAMGTSSAAAIPGQGHNTVRIDESGRILTRFSVLTPIPF